MDNRLGLLTVPCALLLLPGCDQLCGPGTTLEDGVCMADLECGPGTVELDGACICAAPCDDADADGICDDADLCPDDPDNDGDGDELCAGEDPCPDDADPSCEPCTLSSQWEDIAVLTDRAGLHFRGEFIQNPDDGELWYAYTRYLSGFTDTDTVVMRYDDDSATFIAQDVFAAGPGTAIVRGIEFDPSGRLWVAIANDGRPTFRVRAQDGTWSTLEFTDLEPNEFLTADIRDIALVGDDLWVVGDTCLGGSYSGTGDELRAYLIVWKYSTADGTLERVEEPMTMVGNLDDGTPIDLANQGVVKCTRTFPGKVVARPDGQLWVVGGTSSWDDATDPSDDLTIRSEGFIYEGDMGGFVKVLEYRPSDFRSDEAFTDAAVVDDTVFLSHYAREQGNAGFDWRVFTAPIDDLHDLTLVEQFSIDPSVVGGDDRADDMLYHPLSQQVFLSGGTTDANGIQHGLIRVGDASGFRTSVDDDPPRGFGSFGSLLYMDQGANLWSSMLRFDPTDFDPYQGVVRKLSCD